MKAPAFTCFPAVRGAFLALMLLQAFASSQGATNEAVQIGSRLELLADDYLVEHFTGAAELRLHSPTPQNIVLEGTEPWEGNGINYVTVFQDGPKYRMYYRGTHYSYLQGKDRPTTRNVYCYAESLDGIHWEKPALGLYAWEGSTKNNIVLDGAGTHAFAPFHDLNPSCAPDAKYKALGWGGTAHGLFAFKSPDGIHWTLMQPEPVITRGAFDSLNLAFWDAERGEYRDYHRDFRDKEKAVDLIGYRGDRGRDILTATSKDFVHWTEPEFLGYAAMVDSRRNDPSLGNGKAPGDVPSGRVSELYTNQIVPYFRAPHLLLGFPTRYTDRGWTESAKLLPRYDYRLIRAKDSSGRREGTAVTDGMFMLSRDRQHFTVWPESFIRPGLRLRDTWFYGDIYQNWGLVETQSMFEDGPAELSVYLTERALQEKGAIVRRYSLRLDGFVSLHAPLVGGEMITKPLVFAGDALALNVSTSGAGSVRVEVQDESGQAYPGLSLAECHEIYGDDLNRVVAWKSNRDLRELAGKPIRLRLLVRDADVYAFQFQNKGAVK